MLQIAMASYRALYVCKQAYSPEAAAAGSIQAASRRHLARRKVDEAMNWKMFNTLDEHEEQVRRRWVQLRATWRHVELGQGVDSSTAYGA